MGLETATKIGELVPANPPGTDNVSQGDDHVRVVKTAIQGTFSDVGSTEVLSAGEAGLSPAETLGLPGNMKLWTPLAIADFVKANFGGWGLSATTTNAYMRAHNDGAGGAQIFNPDGPYRLPLNVHELDGGGTYDTANARWTPGVTGIYDVTGSWNADPDSNDNPGFIRLEIRVNGLVRARAGSHYGFAGQIVGLHVNDNIEITNVADYIELWTNHQNIIRGWYSAKESTYMTANRVSDLIP